MSLDHLASDEVVALSYDEPAIAEELAIWCGGEVDGELIAVPTPRGPEVAQVGSWIVRDAEGHFRVYERADFLFRFSPAG